MTDADKIIQLTEKLEAERKSLDVLVDLVKSKDPTMIDEWNNKLIAMEKTGILNNLGKANPAHRIARMFRSIFQRYLKI